MLGAEQLEYTLSAEKCIIQPNHRQLAPLAGPCGGSRGQSGAANTDIPRVPVVGRMVISQRERCIRRPFPISTCR